MKKIIMLFAALTFIISSCKKEIRENEVPVETQTMADLTIDDQFNWKTTKDVTLSLSCYLDNTVTIKSLEGDILMKAFLKSGLKFDTKITIPSFVDEVELIYNNQSHMASVANNHLEYYFN